jgi:Hus1-like protein
MIRQCKAGHLDLLLIFSFQAAGNCFCNIEFVFLNIKGNFFSEYNMEGVSVTEANEIYLETIPDSLVRCLRCAQNAKSIKIKLTKKHSPCLTFEVELVSSHCALFNERVCCILLLSC